MVECGWNCFFKDPSKSKSNQIDKDLAKEKLYYKRQVKLLLLGAGESGKSTFLKQMRILYGKDYDETDLLDIRPTIYQNMVKGMKVLVDARDKLNITWGDPSRQSQADYIMAFDRYMSTDSEVFLQCVPHIRELWKDDGIQTAYERRREFQLGESVRYFYENLDRIGQKDYIPSKQDMLLSRKATKGIQEYIFEIRRIPFRFFDVGGQRSQRQVLLLLHFVTIMPTVYKVKPKSTCEQMYIDFGIVKFVLPIFSTLYIPFFFLKWFQCFEDVTSILFMASSSEFDQVLMEDRKTNRLRESLDIFEVIVNNVYFSNVSIILFLNKNDLLEEKVTHGVRISNYFPQFEGDNQNLADVQNFLVYNFESQRKDRRKPFFHHFTMAINTNNIRFVFNAVKDTILQENLQTLMLQ